eukprot:CAMPEP_0170891908 /NCGR_PEP_ID=MMETSP0734-20130129/41285_1 /TAXON_ID=186038 /ORGANISM="Fragilariopsis kerguelensis, Strain L26-C5" /LENGTH=351 /DNA_ID=CAMNT_0011281661 /DNA_START=376 /DNA_END=1432 /DNA_ORIENTATION=+
MPTLQLRFQSRSVIVAAALLLIVLFISTTSTTTTTTTTILWVAASTAGCTSCADGSSMMTSAPQPMCNQLSRSINGLFATDHDCLENQLLTYQKGCCPKAPFDYCSYCEDPLIEPELEYRVPTGQFVEQDAYTCYDYKYQNEALIGMFQDGSCADTFLRRADIIVAVDPPRYKNVISVPIKNHRRNHTRPIRGSPSRIVVGLNIYFHSSRKMNVQPSRLRPELNQTDIDAQAEIYRCSLCDNPDEKVTNPDFVYTNVLEGSKDVYTKTCRQAEDFAATIIKTPSGCRNTQYFGAARELCLCPSDVVASSSSSSSSYSETTTTTMSLMSMPLSIMRSMSLTTMMVVVVLHVL